MSVSLDALSLQSPPLYTDLLFPRQRNVSSLRDCASNFCARLILHNYAYFRIMMNFQYAVLCGGRLDYQCGYKNVALISYCKIHILYYDLPNKLVRLRFWRLSLSRFAGDITVSVRNSIVWSYCVNCDSRSIELSSFYIRKLNTKSWPNEIHKFSWDLKVRSLQPTHTSDKWMETYIIFRVRNNLPKHLMDRKIR